MPLLNEGMAAPGMNSMRSGSNILMKCCAMLGVLLCLATAKAFSPSDRGGILKVVINDTIQPVSEEFIARALDEAGRRQADAVLIDMNTPGGLLDSTRKI